MFKLLRFIGKDDGIARGNLGQSVEAIVSSLPAKKRILLEIAQSQIVEIHTTEYATLILAMHDLELSKNILMELNKEGSWLAGVVIENISDFGYFNPYQ